MKLPFSPKKTNNGSPSPKRQKQRTLNAYERSQQRRKDYAKRIKGGV